MAKPKAYFCQPGTELLKLDCLELDKTMRHLFKDCLSDKISLVDQNGNSLNCELNLDDNLLQGQGLGKFIKSLKKDSFYLAPVDKSVFSFLTENSCAPIYPFNYIPKPHIHFNNGASNDDSFDWDFSISSPAEFRLHQQALHFASSPGFDVLLSLNIVRNIEPYDYQIKTVKHVLERMRGRVLLADEVGLGKTIEAGLVMMEYIIRGLIKKVLILTPPSLIQQWQEEMQSKFNLDFITDDNPQFKKVENGWTHYDRIIASLDRAKRRANQPRVCEPEYDLVIVDEAHRCKNSKGLGWQLVNRIKKRYLMLLTATPIENSMEELFNLITLLSPGQLDTAQSFRHRFISPKDKLKPRNTDSLKKLLRDIIIRNRRSDTDSITVKRYAETIAIPLSAAEQELYEDITNLVRRQFKSKKKTGLNQLSLKTLQRQVGSSSWALGPTLLKMASNKRHSTELRSSLNEIAIRALNIKHNSKTEALIKILTNLNGKKTLVFTGFQQTREYVVNSLQNAGFKVATLHGSMTRADKEKAVEEFKHNSQVLVSTESGGEGRNLQFCHVLINYDLPWNPMRIEQRIGRIHRIGQKKDVFIYNLSAKGTIEARILELLDAKINMFQLVIGEMDMILGNLKERRDFEDIIMDIWTNVRDDEELSQRLDTFGNQLLEAKNRYSQVKNLGDNLLGELLPDDE